MCQELGAWRGVCFFPFLSVFRKGFPVAPACAESGAWRPPSDMLGKGFAVALALKPFQCLSASQAEGFHVKPAQKVAPSALHRVEETFYRRLDGETFAIATTSKPFERFPRRRWSTAKPFHLFVFQGQKVSPSPLFFKKVSPLPFARAAWKRRRNVFRRRTTSDGETFLRKTRKSGESARRGNLFSGFRKRSPRRPRKRRGCDVTAT